VRPWRWPWPATRKRVAAVYTAACAGPINTAIRTMSSRWRASWTRLVTARGLVNAQNSRHGARSGVVPAGDGRSRWRCRSHHAASSVVSTHGSAQAALRSGSDARATAGTTSPSCRRGRVTRSRATVGSITA
jgi:hypothetical protein